MKVRPSTLVRFLFPKTNFFLFQQIWEWKQNEKFCTFKERQSPSWKRKSNFILCPLTVLGSTRRINYTSKYIVFKDYFKWEKINRAALVWFVLFVALKAIRFFIYLKEHFWFVLFSSTVNVNALRRIFIPCHTLATFSPLFRPWFWVICYVCFLRKQNLSFLTPHCRIEGEAEGVILLSVSFMKILSWLIPGGDSFFISDHDNTLALIFFHAVCNVPL